ncbi:MAG: glycosyltransferase family 4 protein [Hyphomicrobiaceae bacterium]
MILVLTQNFLPDVGGIEVYVTQLVKALAAGGERVTVFADATRGAQALDATLDGVTVRRFGGPRPLRRLRKAFAAHRWLATTPCKGIFCDSWKSIDLQPRPRVPVVVLAHGNEYLPRGWRWRRRVARAMRKTDVVIANSRYTAGLVQPYARDETIVQVLHPPVAPLPDAEPAALARVAELMGRKRPLLVGVGRLEPRKGFDKVIAALPALAQRFPGVMLAIGGDGPDRARLQALAQEKGVADRVRLLGRVDDAMRAALLSSADLFVMPTRRVGRSVEGYGIVYVEAAWYGLPSVAGAEGGGAEAVVDGETGCVVDGDDETAVLRGIERLLSDDTLRKRMGETAQRRVRRQGTWAARIDDYLAALNAAGAARHAHRA